MKLSNFLKYDPTYKGIGLTSGSHLEREVWSTFANDRSRLTETAAAILAGAHEFAAHGISIAADEEDDEEAEEGRILTALHNRRERQPALVRKKKQQVIKQTGALECEVCQFDFASHYGKLGEGFAECHHGRPVSSLTAGDKTKISDLQVLCANCHRMLHRQRPWLTVDQLRARLSAPKCEVPSKAR
jgi:5-methylcytosine-specific restriction protein A